MLPADRLCVIEERTKLLSPFQMIRPVFCQPPVYLTVNSVSAVQLVPSAARSWPMKFTGPSDVAAAAASSSKSAVGMCSWPPENVNALSGEPPLRVWRCHCAPSAAPSNSSERVGTQPAPESTRIEIVLTVETLPIL